MYETPYPTYEGGDFGVFDNVDFDTLTIEHLVQMMQCLGTFSFLKFYTITDANGVHKLEDDSELNHLCKEAIRSEERFLRFYAMDDFDQVMFAANPDLRDEYQPDQTSDSSSVE